MDRSGDWPVWRRCRYAFVLSFVASLVVLSAILRLVLYSQFRPVGTPPREIGVMFVVGLYRDIFIAVIFAIPLLLWFFLVPNRWFQARWHRWMLGAGMTLFWMAQVFITFAEFYFVEEFRSRFNTVAVDYLLYPHEVFINIWDTYPVGLVVGGCAVAAVSWVATTFKLFGGIWQEPVSRRLGLAYLLGSLALAGVMSAWIS